MGLNRIAKGIVLVPSLLLGVAFLCAALWGDGPAGANRSLALALGAMLLLVALLSQFLPEASTERATADPTDGAD
jgi:hypothetical protein